MDAHPTPYPGKRRPSVAKTAKMENNSKNKQAEEVKPSPTAANPRSKRTFGVPRSTNIPVEKPTKKPLSPKISKPWKPSGAPAKLVKTKPVNKNSQNVTFSDLAKVNAQQVKSFKKEVPSDVTTPPISLVKSLEKHPETPYLSAVKCGNCKFDMLKTSSYWINQIKLAESVGKHFVSAAFFRLALECQAEPLCDIQSELKHYCKRNEAVSTDPLWGNLCDSYWKFDEKVGFEHQSCHSSDFVLIEEVQNVEMNSNMHKERCLEYVYINKVPLDTPGEELVKDMQDDFIDLKVAVQDKENASMEDSRKNSLANTKSKLSIEKATRNSSGGKADQPTSEGKSDDPQTNLSQIICPNKSHDVAKDEITDQAHLCEGLPDMPYT